MFNGNKNGFSIIKFILACLIFLFCLFLIMGIIKKSTPNLDPIYDSIFRDNINSMQDAGEAYFTNDKLPKEIGEEVKITLQEMLDKNYILPFTDKNGEACNLTESYSLVVKTKDGYELRTFLKCGDESHMIVKVLGCHNLCEGECSQKTCTREKILQYQFYKLNKVTKTVYSCKEGKLSGKKCIISYIDTKKPTTKTTTKTESKPADVVVTKTKVGTIVTPTTTTVKVDDKVDKTSTRIYTDPTKTTETTCITEQIPDPNCHVQCVPTYVNGVLQDVCNTCGYVSHKKCTDHDVWKCPNTYTQSGSGSSSTCYKDVYTYSCPSVSTNHSGSDSSLKCWHYKTVTGTPTYSCPSNSNYSEGSGSSLVCYIKTTSNKCDTANGWKLKDGKCYKTTTTTTKVCDSGYTLKDGQCTKKATKKVNATSKKVTSSYKVYKWSKEEALSGWTRTGKTKEILGKEVCE